MIRQLKVKGQIEIPLAYRPHLGLLESRAHVLCVKLRREQLESLFEITDFAYNDFSLLVSVNRLRNSYPVRVSPPGTDAGFLQLADSEGRWGRSNDMIVTCGLEHVCSLAMRFWNRPIVYFSLLATEVG